MGMLSIFGKMLGSEKALAGIVNGATSALDKLYYTDEEKAEDAAKSRSEARGMVIKWMEATGGQNLARRVISLVVTAVWIFQYVLVMIMGAISPWVDAGTAAKIMLSSESISENAQSMNGAMMLILGFYFAAPHMGKIAEAAMAKFDKGAK